MSVRMDVGVIGLGRMGRGMAAIEATSLAA